MWYTIWNQIASDRKKVVCSLWFDSSSWWCSLFLACTVLTTVCIYWSSWVSWFNSLCYMYHMLLLWSLTCTIQVPYIFYCWFVYGKRNLSVNLVHFLMSPVPIVFQLFLKLLSWGGVGGGMGGNVYSQMMVDIPNVY